MTLEEDAKEVYNKLKVELEEIGFPNNCCKVAVIEMSKKGYGIIAGIVKLDNYCLMKTSHEQSHYWNFDPVTGNEFDITASQFNIHINDPKMPQIMVWKHGENPHFKSIDRGISPDYVF